MSDITPEGKSHGQQFRAVRDRSVGREVLASAREVSLSKLLLYICDRLGAQDSSQEFLELYNSVKPIAESTLRRRP